MFLQFCRMSLLATSKPHIFHQHVSPVPLQLVLIYTKRYYLCLTWHLGAGNRKESRSYPDTTCSSVWKRPDVPLFGQGGTFKQKRVIVLFLSKLWKSVAVSLQLLKRLCKYLEEMSDFRSVELFWSQLWGCVSDGWNTDPHRDGHTKKATNTLWCQISTLKTIKILHSGRNLWLIIWTNKHSPLCCQTSIVLFPPEPCR